MKYQTSIRCSSTTKDRLALLGNKGDSYDDVINGLIDYFEASKKVHDRLITRRSAN